MSYKVEKIISNPLVSVIMCVRNADRYVDDAVKSILTQTLDNFEFIIIDDGSDDTTPRIIKRYASIDNRIRLILRQKAGLTESLNECLQHARGVYIARQDADDISLPWRLQIQVEHMSHHPSAVLLGCAAKEIDENGKFTGQIRSREGLTDDIVLKWKLLFKNQFVHTSVMVRREIIVNEYGGYDSRLVTSQDFDLWSRMSWKHEVRNLADVLVHCRTHSQQHSVNNRGLKFKNTREISHRNLRILDVKLSQGDFDAVHNSLGNSEQCSSTDIIRTAGVLPLILQAFVKRYGYPQQALKQIQAGIETSVMQGVRHALSNSKSKLTPQPFVSLNPWIWLHPRHAYLLRKTIRSSFTRLFCYKA